MGESRCWKQYSGWSRILSTVNGEVVSNLKSRLRFRKWRPKRNRKTYKQCRRSTQWKRKRGWSTVRITKMRKVSTVDDPRHWEKTVFWMIQNTNDASMNLAKLNLRAIQTFVNTTKLLTHTCQHRTFLSQPPTLLVTPMMEIHWYGLSVPTISPAATVQDHPLQFRPSLPTLEED